MTIQDYIGKYIVVTSTTLAAAKQLIINQPYLLTRENVEYIDGHITWLPGNNERFWLDDPERQRQSFVVGIGDWVHGIGNISDYYNGLTGRLAGIEIDSYREYHFIVTHSDHHRLNLGGIYCKNVRRALIEEIPSEFITISSTTASTTSTFTTNTSSNHNIYLGSTSYVATDITIGDDCKEAIESPIEQPKNIIIDKIQWKPINTNQKFTYLQEQLVRCILYKPEKLRKYIADCSNPGYAANFINSLFPTRVGYELDVKSDDKSITDWLESIQDRSTKYAKYAESKKYFWTDGHSMNFGQDSELRFSFTSIYSLKLLKEILNKLNNSKEIEPLNDGGLHIHIDLTKNATGYKYNGGKNHLKSNIERLNRKKELEKYKNYIFNVFEIPKTGTGADIRRRSGTIGNKLAICRNLPTAEWRLLNTTFSYEKIVRYTIFCHLMTETIKSGRQFNKALFEKVMLVE